MKYQTKLFIILLGLTLATNGVLLSIFYRNAKEKLLEQSNSGATSIAATIAACVNANELQQIKKYDDMNTPLYKKYEIWLRKMRDANRRPDMYVNYVFTLMSDPNRPSQILFGVDSTEPGPNKSNVGDIYHFTTDDSYTLNSTATQKHFLKDEWGEWQEAHAPIFDSDGKLTGAIGVDIDSRRLKNFLHKLMLDAYLSLGASALMALAFAWFLSRRFSEPLQKICARLNQIGQGDLETKVIIKTKDEFATIGVTINEMIAGLRQRDHLKISLTRYLSSQLAEKIIETGQLPEIRGERRKVTILFCDIRNFTTFAEKMPPEKVVSILNTAFGAMVNGIFEYNGMLDKFLGDGFMAIFGAPFNDDLQEEHAIRAAFAIQSHLFFLAKKWKQKYGLDFKMGIGINTGIAIVGNIGSEQKMEYTAIGDTVNLASRIETATKELGFGILVSESTYQATAHLFSFSDLGSIKVKGRVEPINIYKVEG